MAYREDRVPDHLLIKIEQPDHPVSEVSEDDARRRSVLYPRLMWGAPVFGAAEHDGGRWRIVRLDDDEPQHARDSLASHFRRLYSELPEHASARAGYESAYELLDWEPVNELRVDGRRYRIIRAQPFIRMGEDGPEPSRPTDPSTSSSILGRPQMDGFVLDPTASTGLTDGLVRMELASSYARSDSGEQVRAESRQAAMTHPNVVLLPVSFAVSGYVAGVWGQRGPHMYPTPQAARDGGSFSMGSFVLDENTVREEFLAAYERAQSAHQPPAADDFEVDGVRCRVTRVETFVRFGPDGPEGPRPSDRDSYPPPARQADDLRAQGLMPDPD